MNEYIEAYTNTYTLYITCTHMCVRVFACVIVLVPVNICNKYQLYKDVTNIFFSIMFMFIKCNFILHSCSTRQDLGKQLASILFTNTISFTRTPFIPVKKRAMFVCQ